MLMELKCLVILGMHPELDPRWFVRTMLIKPLSAPRDLEHTLSDTMTVHRKSSLQAQWYGHTHGPVACMAQWHAWSSDMHGPVACLAQ